jgi:hypothetical protein
MSKYVLGVVFCTLLLTGCLTEKEEPNLSGLWVADKCPADPYISCSIELVKEDSSVNNLDYSIALGLPPSKKKRYVSVSGAFKFENNPSSKFSIDGQKFLKGAFIYIDKYDESFEKNINISIYSPKKLSIRDTFYRKS